MSDSEFVLVCLREAPHTSARILERSYEERGHGLTVHSRVAQLRKDGWDIRTSRVKGSREYAYQLIGKLNRRVRVRMENPVQGYVYDSYQDGNPRNETICRIIKRAVISDAALREGGPAFVVEFGDGQRETAYSVELHPWYPV